MPTASPPRWASLSFVLVAAGGLSVSLFPLLDELQARHQARAALDRARFQLRGRPEALQPTASSVRCDEAAVEALVRVAERAPALTSWGNIGGCGAGGTGPSGGGVKWIGRGVTGGLVDVQCLAGRAGYSDGATGISLATRVGTSIGYKWLVGLNVPFLYNVAEVNVYGTPKTARLPGFGDLGLEATRKLGVTNASTATLSLTVPTGSQDAVRQGIVLPQRMQLGAGVPTAALSFEHTLDQSWGVIVLGGTASYGGWVNRLGDQRASTASGYAFAGYLLGPFVPSAGVTLTSKLLGDRERNQLVPEQPMWLATPQVAAEWSSDLVAVLLAGSLPLSPAGVQSWNVSLGLKLTLF
ncbi:MAG: hypothetical protein HYZ28_00550 [Myxococcales bacterium]|nr:hypothetical protein [Myxococcales bacterium]